MKAEVNSEFDLHNIQSRSKTCCIALHFKRAAENQLSTCRTCAPVAILSDKWKMFRLFAFNRKVSNYLTSVEYARCGQYSNVVEFEPRHIPTENYYFLSQTTRIHSRTEYWIYTYTNTLRLRLIDVCYMLFTIEQLRVVICSGSLQAIPTQVGLPRPETQSQNPRWQT